MRKLVGYPKSAKKTNSTWNPQPTMVKPTNERGDILAMDMAGDGIGITGWIRTVSFAYILAPFGLFVGLCIGLGFPVIAFAPAFGYGLGVKILGIITFIVFIYALFNHDFAFNVCLLISAILFIIAAGLFTTVAGVVVYYVGRGLLKLYGFI